MFRKSACFLGIHFWTYSRWTSSDEDIRWCNYCKTKQEYGGSRGLLETGIWNKIKEEKV